MKFQLFSLRDPSISRDWSQQELAEFYRVESVLASAGIAVELERGLSDEGDPWIVFCRPQCGDVVIHFARCDGFYIAASGAFGQALKGRNFRDLVDAFIARQPLVVPKGRDAGTVVLHPSALLSALVASALLLVDGSEADASALPVHDLDGTLADNASQVVKSGRFADLVNLLVEPLPPHEQREAVLAIGAIVAGIAAVSFDLAKVSPAIQPDIEGDLFETLRKLDIQSSDERRFDLNRIGHRQLDAPDLSVVDGPGEKEASNVESNHSELVEAFAWDDAHLKTETSFPFQDPSVHGYTKSTPEGGFGEAELAFAFLPAMGAKNIQAREILLSRAQQEAAEATKPSNDHQNSIEGTAGQVVSEFQSHDKGDTGTLESLALNLAKAVGGSTNLHPLIVDASLVPELSQFDFAKLTANSFDGKVFPLTAVTANSNPVDFSEKADAGNVGASTHEGLTASEEKAVAAINFFAKSNPDFKIAQMGRDMILFDFDARPDHVIVFDVHSWSLPDGSKITIIGSIPDQFVV